MSNASSKHMGPGSKGKGSGTGAMTSEKVADERVEENMILSNRDKSRHSDERGLDSRGVQTDQLQETPMSRNVPGDAGEERGEEERRGKNATGKEGRQED